MSRDKNRKNKSQRSSRSHESKMNKELDKLYEKVMHLRSKVRDSRDGSRSSRSRSNNNTRRTRSNSNSNKRSRGSRDDNYYGGERDPRGASRHSRRRHRSPSTSHSSSTSLSSLSSLSDFESSSSSHCKKRASSSSSSSSSSGSGRASRKRRRYHSSSPTSDNSRKHSSEKYPSTDSETMEFLENDDENEQNGLERNPALPEPWLQISKSGHPEEKIEELIKKYPIPSNLKALQPTELDPKLKALLGKSALEDDNRLVLLQKQLSAGITALGICLTELIIKPKDEIDTPKLIVNLEDAGKILADLHYRMSMHRRSLITPGLSKLMRSVAEDCEIDTWLFGKNFAKKLKAAKLAEKTSYEFEKILTTTTTTNGNHKERANKRQRRSSNSESPRKRSRKENRRERRRRSRDTKSLNGTPRRNTC